MKNTVSLARAAMIAMTSITAITVAAEYLAPFKEALGKITGHHWVTKSVLAVLIFAVGYALLSALTKPGTSSPARATNQVTLVALLNSAVLFGFFILHYLQTH